MRLLLQCLLVGLVRRRLVRCARARAGRTRLCALQLRLEIADALQLLRALGIKALGSLLCARRSVLPPRGEVGCIAAFTFESLHLRLGGGRWRSAAALLRAVVPPILAALSFGARCAEYQLAGCMLLTQVCAQRALEPAVAQSMLQALMRAVDAEVAAPAALAKPLLCVVWRPLASSHLSVFGTMLLVSLLYSS